MFIVNLKLKSFIKENKLKINFLQKYKFFEKIFIKNKLKQTNKKKIFTVLKSPHVFKKSREHFIYKYYKNNYILKSNNIVKIIYFLIFLNKKILKQKLIKIKFVCL